MEGGREGGRQGGKSKERSGRKEERVSAKTTSETYLKQKLIILEVLVAVSDTEVAVTTNIP